MQKNKDGNHCFRQRVYEFVVTDWTNNLFSRFSVMKPLCMKPAPLKYAFLNSEHDWTQLSPDPNFIQHLQMGSGLDVTDALVAELDEISVARLQNTVWKSGGCYSNR